MYSEEQIKEALKITSINDERPLQALKDISINNTLSNLLQRVCALSDITGEQAKSKSKKIEYVKARLAFALIAKEKFPYISENFIMDFIEKNHATMMYYKNIIKYDTMMINFYEYIKKNIE